MMRESRLSGTFHARVTGYGGRGGAAGNYTAAVEQELSKLVRPAVIADVRAYIAASADLRRAAEKYAPA
jgi:hypothetical protein